MLGRDLFDLEQWLCVHHPKILLEYQTYDEQYIIKEDINDNTWEEEE